MMKKDDFEISQLPGNQAMVYGNGADEQYRLLREISEPETLRVNSFTFNPQQLESSARSTNPALGYAIGQDITAHSESIAAGEHLLSGDNAQEQFNAIQGLTPSATIRVTNFTINTEALLADAAAHSNDALQTAQSILAKIPQIAASTPQDIGSRSYPTGKGKGLG